MKIGILLLVSLVPLSCVAQPDVAPVAEPVPEFESALDEAQYHYESATREVDEVFHLIIQKIDADEYEDTLVPKEMLDESLYNGQMAWGEYRERHCHALEVLRSGGTSHQVDYLECFTRLSEQRTQELRDLYL